MSCNTEQDVRIIMKYSTISGVEPTIPLSADHNDGTWLPTDIYIGEIFTNTADDLTWIRTDNGIAPLAGSFSATYSFTGDFVPTGGGTFSGCVYIPCLTVGSASISELTVENVTGGYIYGTFSGDGSGLTGITTTWDGGTVSNPVYFTNTVDFTNTININGPIVGDIDLTGSVEVSGGVSASIFYGDGSGLTNLPTGTYSDIYTTAASLSGNSIVFDRNDLIQYSVDLTPILATQGVATIGWNSGTNQLDLTLLNGDVVSTTIDGFDNLTALTSVTAPEFYGGTYYGSFVGTFSGVIENDVFSTTASLVGTELIIQRNDGGTFSTDLSSLAGGGATLEEVLINGNYAGTNWIEFPKPYGIKSNSTSYNDTITFNGGGIRITSETATASSSSFLAIGYNSVNLSSNGSIYVNANTTMTIDGDANPTFTGIEYKSDYSANFVTYSLITKQYVDSSISGVTTSNVFQPGIGVNAITNKGDGTNLAKGIYSFAMGQQNNTDGSFSSTIGFGNLTSRSHAIAIGRNNVNTGDYSFSYGEANTITGSYSGALGFTNDVTGIYAFSMGRNNEVGGLNSLGFGRQNVITDNYGVALGRSNTISAEGGITIGIGNDVSGVYSSAIGNGNTVSGNGSHVISNDSEVYSTQSGIFGGSTNTINLTSEKSVILGGAGNVVYSTNSGILGGFLNQVGTTTGGLGTNGAIVGGASNIVTVNAQNSVIIGGSSNQVGGNRSAVIGGQLNDVSGNYSAAIGGGENVVTGARSVTIGGAGLPTNSEDDTVMVPDLTVIGSLYVNTQISTKVSTLTLVANSASYDCDQGMTQILDLEGATSNTTIGIVQPKDGSTYTFYIIQGSGGYDVSFGSGKYWLNDGGAFDFTTLSDNDVVLVTMQYTTMIGWVLAAKKIVFT